MDGPGIGASGPADERVPDERAPQARVVDGEFYPDWEAVYRDNVEREYRLMFSKVGNRADAEDLTAKVFLMALYPTGRWAGRSPGRVMTSWPILGCPQMRRPQTR